MLPPSNVPAAVGGAITNTPFVPPPATPATGLRTRELHGPGYYHIGSPPDPGYVEQMRYMYGASGREDIEPPRYDQPHRDLQTSGSSSQGTSSQSNQRTVWQNRMGQGIPAFPGSRIIPTRAIDQRETAYQRTVFGTT
jgi:hypothetical protein